MSERVTAATDDDFVVFLLGMRVNSWRAVRTWPAAMRSMPLMLAELRADPQWGLLGAYGGWMFGGPATVQYWRSFDHLVRYARARDNEHLPAWRLFNRSIAGTDAVGIWHETYRITAGQWEAIHVGMPDVGLPGAVGAVPIGPASTAARRMRGVRTDPDLGPGPATGDVAR